MSWLRVVAISCLGVPACFDPGDADVPAGDTGDDTNGSSDAPDDDAPDDDAPDDDASDDADDGMTSADGTTDDGTTDDDGGSSSTTEPVGPHCGDGNLDDGEACDDGDRIDGNGCNADCEPSGRSLWCVVDGDFDEDSGRGITADNEGNVFATGSYFRAGEDDDVWVGGWAPDGTELFLVHHDASSGGYERGADIVYNSSADQLWVLGSLDGDARLYRISTTGDLVDDDVLAVDGATSVNPVAMVAGPSSIYWAGAAYAGAGSNPLIGRLAPTGVQVWAVHSAQGPSAYASHNAVAIDSLGRAVLGGQSTPEGFVRRTETNSGDLELSVGGLAPIAGIAIASNGDVVIATTQFVNAHGNDIVVERRSADTEDLVWSAGINGDANLDDTARAIAVDADDHVVVAGDLQLSNISAQGVVARLDPDGAVLWTTGFDANDGGYTTAADVALDAEGAASVVGSVYGEAGDGDIFVCHFAK
jgi:cysteine-rich repeat protein